MWRTHGSKMDTMLPITLFHQTWFMSWECKRVEAVVKDMITTKKNSISKYFIFFIIVT